MSNVASSRGLRPRFGRPRAPRRCALGLRRVAAVLALLPAFALAQVVAPSGRAANGGPADPESPGAAVIQPLESVVPNPRSKGQARAFEAGDARFVQWARRAVQARVDAARLAVNEGAHPCVRKYAAQVAETHVAMIDEIDVLAAARSLTLSTKLEDADGKLLAALQKLSGPSFDRRFVAAMRAAQERDLVRVRRQVAEAQDPELEALTRDAVPTIAEQVDMLRILTPMVAGPESTSPQGAPGTGCSVF